MIFEKKLTQNHNIVIVLSFFKSNSNKWYLKQLMPKKPNVTSELNSSVSQF